jgi:molecular chaperone GrpE
MKDNKKNEEELEQSSHEEDISEVGQEDKPEKEELEDLEHETEEVVDEDKKQIEYLKDQLARAVAETRNLEKRFLDEKQEFVKYANRDLLLRLLPAFDMLFLAGKYVEDEGVKLTIKRIEDVFSEIGVKRVETEGKQFDPTVMECVETKEGDDGKVLIVS